MTSLGNGDARTSENLDILLVDDEPDLRELLEQVLVDAGHRVVSAGDGAEALTHTATKVFDVVVCDVRLPKIDGLTLFRRLRKEAPSTHVILMTAYAEVVQAVAALKEGAYDYLTKPFDSEELVLQLKRVAGQRNLQRELASARLQLSIRDPQTTLIGQSAAMRAVVDRIEMVAQSDVATLVTGESGTGKELVARMLHDRSPRRDQPFIVVNCGALTENLIEAELFGHERGAFTGADRKRDGRFKAADGGTLFLDEIAELAAPVQTKLLRVLQEGTFEPIGSNVPIKVDVRVVSATHRNLSERIQKGLFREDLFYRVNVIEIALPPLRDRPGDLAMLVQYFLRRFVPEGHPVPALSPDAWDALTQHSYPGNVRELSHAIQHAVVLSGGGEIEVHHLPAGMISAETAGVLPVPPPTNGRQMRSLADATRDFERRYLVSAIAKTRGRRLQAAEILGISRKSLWQKMRSYGISDAEARQMVSS